VHLWLPKAHVEAPVSGSIVLAGVLLKLGFYGFFRFLPLVRRRVTQLKGYFISMGLVGGLISCFLCLRQSDLKSFVAYSSVCHMGYGLGGLFSYNFLGWRGAAFIIIGHGFCSSCLFYILFVFYERLSSRSVIILKGIGFIIPLIRIILFVFSVLNMGVPPSFSFFSEILILTGLRGRRLITSLGRGFLLLFSGIYGIFLYVISCHSLRVLEGFVYEIKIREYLIFFGHFFFMGFFIFSLDYFFF
jgi:NADH-ubiquinone oxidoreductase chain 4